jgi:hypothetical protein
MWDENKSDSNRNLDSHLNGDAAGNSSVAKEHW